MLWWCSWCPSVTTPLMNVKSSWWMNDNERFASSSKSTNLILRQLFSKLCPARAQCTNMSITLVMLSKLVSLITHWFCTSAFFSILLSLFVHDVLRWCASSAQQAVKISGSFLHKDNTGCAFDYSRTKRARTTSVPEYATYWSKLREKVFWCARHQKYINILLLLEEIALPASFV